MIPVRRSRVGWAALPNGKKSLGAVPVGGGLVEFAVWAPDARSVGVRLRGADHPLERDGELWSARVEAAAGDDYLFVLDDGETRPDPCSRFQPEGVRGPSRVVDTGALRQRRRPVPLDELVVYELHVGTFSAEGTFDGAIPHLRALAELGVTAIELMPVATFPGERGWGYDGLYTWAPHPAYGGPEGLARLVAAAHREGLAVLLDVVYNHVGPGSEALAAFGPFFTDRHETFWGDAIDYGRPWVREWAIQNAELWIRDYGVDGLRLDAVHAIFDDGEPHLLRELRDRVKAIDEGALVISEIETGDLRPLEEWGHDAQWADELHHELHVLLTGEREGYYADYGSLEGLAAQLEREPAERLVVCAQNHDQVGNRALGDRPQPDELRVRAAVALFSAHTPLLFQGEEYGEQRPFLLLHRPHRPGDRRGHPGGAQARVRRLRAVLGRAGARPAGARDLRALEARPRAGRPRAAHLLRDAPGAAGGAAARARDPGRGTHAHAPARSRRAPGRLRRADGRGATWRVGSGRASPSRSGRAGTARGRTSRSSPRTPSGSSCACSTARAARRSGSRSPTTPPSTGTATCPASGRGSATATASTGPTSRRAGCASTRRSC